MSIIGSSRLAGMLQDERENLLDEGTLLLLWLVASDGKLEESELDFVSSQFPDASFLAVIRNSDTVTIEKAIRAVAGESRELRIAFLDKAIAMSIVDRDIAIAENHILRFFADALHLGLGMLQKRFQAIAGSEFPEPGDPSSPVWWRETGLAERQDGQQSESGDDGPLSRHGSDSQPVSSMTIAQAQSVLGVKLNATPEDIERAYQDLAAIFEVDHVEAMGDATVSAANSGFSKIQQAYRLLLAKS
jgi:hypothetical protein